jgi:hypothetical protein
MKRDVDRSYLAIVVLLMLVLPLASLLIETREPGLVLVGKWWNFWAIGVRLFTAGLRQVAKPAFTAEVIFHATMQIRTRRTFHHGRAEREGRRDWRHNSCTSRRDHYFVVNLEYGFHPTQEVSHGTRSATKPCERPDTTRVHFGRSAC